MGCDSLGNGGLDAVTDAEVDLSGEHDTGNHGLGGLGTSGDQSGCCFGGQVEGLGLVGGAVEVGEGG